MPGYSKVLVATDFSPPSEAAVRLGAWAADRAQAELTLVHVLADVRRAMHEVSHLARRELAFGDIDKFEHDIRRKSDERLQAVCAGLARPAHCQTLLGEPFVEIIHAVLKDGHDLVVSGTQGRSGWKKFLLGSTATRLVRQCPAAVWVVKGSGGEPPRRILAATDLSPVSDRAVEAALWVARHAAAELHVLHAVDRGDVSPEFLEAAPEGAAAAGLVRRIRSAARSRLEEFVGEIDSGDVRVVPHVVSGTAWKEINKAAKKLEADLVALGTVGRSGIPGMLLGNTAEKVLASCDANLLTVKQADFVSPIQAPFWPLGGERAPGGSEGG